MTHWTRRDVSRAGALGGAALLLARTAPFAWAAKTDYARDVEFLLEELGKKAAPLLRQKGVDWKAVEKEFRAAAKKVRTDADHLTLCRRLLARLRDGHAGVVKTDVKLPDESNGRKWAGPGVTLAVAGKDVLVKQSWSAAQDVGVPAGAVVREIDERPAMAWLTEKVAEMRDTNGYSTDHHALYFACHLGLGDWSGTVMKLAYTNGGAKVEKANVTRRGASLIPSGYVFPPKDLTETGRQKYGRTAAGLGYLHLRDVPGELPTQVDEALAAIGDVPGLILDCRANGGGGCDHADVFGRFLPKGATWEEYRCTAERPYAGPIVVIVDSGVRSAGETVAGMFKENGRAYVIGDGPTAGMSARKEDLTVPSGMFSVRFAVETHGKAYNMGRGIEGIGVPPHEVVPYVADELAKGVDTQIRRAEELLSKGFPKGVVRWTPR